MYVRGPKTRYTKGKGEMFMFCKYCGAQLKDNSKFCASCGAKLESDSSSARTVRPNTTYANAAPSNPNHSNTAIPNSAIPNAAVPNAAVPLGKKKRTFNIGNFVIWAGCVIEMCIRDSPNSIEFPHIFGKILLHSFIILPA